MNGIGKYTHFAFVYVGLVTQFIVAARKHDTHTHEMGRGPEQGRQRRKAKYYTLVIRENKFASYDEIKYYDM